MKLKTLSEELRSKKIILGVDHKTPTNALVTEGKFNKSKIEISIETLPEDITPEEAFEDSGVDQGTIDEINDRLASGDMWAWCTVKVTASYNGIEGTDYLGGCSYKDEDDFILNSGYYKDMVKSATAECYVEIKKMKKALNLIGEGKKLVTEGLSKEVKAYYDLAKSAKVKNLEITGDDSFIFYDSDGDLVEVEFDGDDIMVFFDSTGDNMEIELGEFKKMISESIFRSAKKRITESVDMEKSGLKRIKSEIVKAKEHHDMLVKVSGVQKDKKLSDFFNKTTEECTGLDVIGLEYTLDFGIVDDDPESDGLPLIVFEIKLSEDLGGGHLDELNKKFGAYKGDAYINAHDVDGNIVSGLVEYK